VKQPADEIPAMLREKKKAGEQLHFQTWYAKLLTLMQQCEEITKYDQSHYLRYEIEYNEPNILAATTFH
jgi:hypothetical protein